MEPPTADQHDHTASDQDLLRDYAARGAQAAFARLVGRHVDMVYNAARRQLGPHADLAEDVTQTVFLLLATKARAGAIGPTVVIAGWLYTTTRNAAANARRSAAHRTRHERKAAVMTSPITPAEGDSDAAPSWDAVAPLLDDALGRLPAPDRDAVLLKYLGGQSHRAVAAALGTTEEAARKRVSRALDRLRALLARRGVAVPAAALATLMTTHAATAAPDGLATAVAGAVATSAGTAATGGSLAGGLHAMTTWARAKIAAALLAVVVTAGVGAPYALRALGGAAPRAQVPPAAPAPPIAVNLKPADAPPAPARTVDGTVVRADGQPIGDAEVYLATPRNGINLYTRRQRTRQLQFTEPDGTFSFPRPLDENWKIVAMTDDGMAEVMTDDLAKSRLVVLQPWGRIEGTLYAATRPIPDASVQVGELGWGNDPLGDCVTSQTVVKTDKAGRFVLPRVPPGAPLLSHQFTTPTYQSAKWECVTVAPGQTVKVDLGATGRPVVAKLTVPTGWENQVVFKTDRLHYWEISARVLKPLDLLGGINPHMGGLPMPPGWHKMSPREQHVFRRNWERSPEGVASRRHMFPEKTTIASDGTFRFDALRPGRYALTVNTLVLVPDQDMLEHVAGAALDFTVPPLPPDTKVTEEPVDLGDLPLKPVPRIAPGTPAPPFRARTLDGKPVSLDDYQGKYLVLSIRSPHPPDSTSEGLKKAHAAFAADPRVAMLTVHLDASAAAIRKTAAEQGLNWPQATATPIPETEPPQPAALNPSTWFKSKPPAGDVPPAYQRGPASIFLIGPDGIVITKILRGEDAETTLAKILLERK